MRNGFPSTETPPPCLERFLTEERQPLLGEECRGVWFFRVFRVFSSWDCRLDSRSVAASVYEVWLQMTLQEVFKTNGWSEETLFLLLGQLGFWPPFCCVRQAQRSEGGRSRLSLLPPFQSVHQLWPSSSGGWLHPTWMPRTEALNHWRGNLLRALKNPSELRNWAALFAEGGQCLQRLFLDDANSSLCLSLQTPNLFLKKTLSAV